jgi:hypothetical protein
MALTKARSPDSSFALSSLFHNTPEKMPAEHSILAPGRHF